MDHQRFIGHIQARAALETPDAARLVVVETLMEISRSLDRAAASDVLDVLPAPLRDLLRRGLDPSEPGPLGSVKDHTAVVCEALAGELDDRSLTRLRQLLPEDIARFLVRYHAPVPRSMRSPHGAHMRREFVEGRPVSQQPEIDTPQRSGQLGSGVGGHGSGSGKGHLGL